MSDRMSVSLNWDRLCIVCEKEGEEPRREEATEKQRKDRDEVARHMEWESLGFIFRVTEEMKEHL